MYEQCSTYQKNYVMLMENGENICIFSHHHNENLQHIIFYCCFAKTIWSLPPFTGGVMSDTSDIGFKEHYNLWYTGNERMADICAIKCQFIWKERCTRNFEEKTTSSVQISFSIQRYIDFWCSKSTKINRSPILMQMQETTTQDIHGLNLQLIAIN